MVSQSNPNIAAVSDVAKRDLNIDSTDLTEGEAWALTDILKTVQNPEAENKHLFTRHDNA